MATLLSSWLTFAEKGTACLERTNRAIGASIINRHWKRDLPILLLFTRRLDITQCLWKNGGVPLCFRQRETPNLNMLLPWKKLIQVLHSRLTRSMNFGKEPKRPKGAIVYGGLGIEIKPDTVIFSSKEYLFEPIGRHMLYATAQYQMACTSCTLATIHRV